MAIINLGINKKDIDNVNVTYSGPRTPFPANPVGYTKYTGEVTDLQIKQSQDGKRAWLWVQVTNGRYQDSILINLDPSDISPNTRPENVEKMVKRNLDTLLRAVKVFDISNFEGTGIDTNKFEQAKGTLISIGVKRGDMQENGYYKYYTTFYGKAESLIPVEGPHSPLPETGKSDADDSDIPF